MCEEERQVRSMGTAARKDRRVGQKPSAPAGAAARPSFVTSQPSGQDALVRLAGYLVPLWPKLTAGVLCLIVVCLLSLYNGILAKHLLRSIENGNEPRLNHYALLAVVAFLAKGLF